MVTREILRIGQQGVEGKAPKLENKKQIEKNHRARENVLQSKLIDAESEVFSATCVAYLNGPTMEYTILCDH